MLIASVTGLLILYGLLCISCFYHAARNNRSTVSKKLLTNTSTLSQILEAQFKQPKLNAFLFSINGSQHVLRVLFVIIVLALVESHQSLTQKDLAQIWDGIWTSWGLLISSLGFILATSYILFSASDVIPRWWAQKSPETIFRFATTPTLVIVIPLLPLFVILEKILSLFNGEFVAVYTPTKAHLIELLRELDDRTTVSEGDKKLLQSVLSFKDKIAREIMMPRVDLFCISEDILLKDAVTLINQEGYSRIPIYRGSIDNIVGVLLYKDLLAIYMQPNPQKDLDKPIKTLAKRVYYCPETKPIPSLLQELKKRQSHMAVVVDEYGGTSGIVTIEDILEEIVGRIEDEYDTGERSFRRGAKGSWIVDAKMNLSDLESEIGIFLPQEDEYDTVAGFIFYKAGAIPPPGTSLHMEKYDITILKSDDRTVDEVQITPIKYEGN